MAWVAASLVEKLQVELQMSRDRGGVVRLDLPHKCVALVLEDAYFLYRAVGRKRFLQHLLAECGKGAINAAHINGAIGGTALVVDLVES